MSAKVIQVIQVDELRGAGTVAEPFRSVTAYYTPQGHLLWEFDPNKPYRCLGRCCVPAKDSNG